MFNKWRNRPSVSEPTEVVESIRPTSTSDTGLEATVTACRRVSALRSRVEIHRQAVTEAIALTNAEIGAFVVARGDATENARFTFQSHPQMFIASQLGDGAIARVLTEREPVCEIVEREPSIAVSPISLAAVPCIASGDVIGTIVVLRDRETPFGNTELEVLRMMASVTGAAHAAAAPSNEKAELDEVTRLANRRRLDRDFLDLTREGQVGFAAISIDFFAEFSAANGRDASDELLRQVALAVASSIRPDDVAYRSGNAEFGVLLPGASKKESAWVAERVRQAIAMVTISGMESQPGGHVTVSVGVTAGEHEDPQRLTERAMAAMHEAEDAGHDQVITDEAI